MTTLALTLNFYHFSTATPTRSYPGCQGHDMSTFSQCHTQSPQASWSAGGRRGRLWGNGIVTGEILWFMVLSFVTVIKKEIH